jgi:hypothetical protein
VRQRISFALDCAEQGIAEDHLSDCCYASEDKVDAGEELLAVVVLAQLRGHLTHERVLRGVVLRPPCGDAREEGRSIRLARAGKHAMHPEESPS